MEWISDLVGPGLAQAMQIDAILYDGRSAFQHIQVATSRLFGRMLILDDAIQTTERDEYAYHEMLAHLALITHPAPQRALIIGGGDGGTLEESLKHPLQHVTMVEIDRAVVDVCRRFMPGIWWSFSYGSKRHDPRRVTDETITHRLAAIPTRFYGPPTHATALRLPPLP